METFSRSHLILPAVVVPSPPAILTNTEVEDNDEELELPHLEQEETTHPVPSSNLDPNNPVNLKMRSDSDENLIPHVPISSGTGSSQRTLQNTDQEDSESEDSQRTRPYDDQEPDLVLDEAHWSFMTAEVKICVTRRLRVPSYLGVLS